MVQQEAGGAWNEAIYNQTLAFASTIRLEKHSRAAILLPNDTIIRLDQNSSVSFPTEDEEGYTTVKVIKGKVGFLSRIPRKLRVITDIVEGTVEGTEFLVLVAETEVSFSVYSGEVSLLNKQGQLQLVAGQAAITQAGGVPTLQAIVKYQNAVQWAMYYPPVIDASILSRLHDKNDKGNNLINLAIRAFQQGNLTESFDFLDSISSSKRDDLWKLLQSSLLLAVGRVGEAENLLHHDYTSFQAEKLSLSALTAMVLNDRDTALEDAEKAVSIDSNSVPAQIVLSLAHQAKFEIEDAYAVMQETADKHPQSVLALTRTAELAFASGDLRIASQLIEQAKNLNEDNGYTETITGFIRLSIGKTEEAMAAFEKAITLSQGDPMPRLGLGLAKIRKNKIVDGRELLEIAVALDPGRSLLRSYLGKAYTEENRSSIAIRQLTIAEKLDPEDPTPDFYRALHEQSENQPIKALHSLQKSLVKNDNRQVYRSRLLLDEDASVRSAAQARVYRDLGFEQLAKNTTYKSLSNDPSNHSAHRLLAEMYASRPEHEIARVSEVLQAQLLQPLNGQPVPPQLSEQGMAISREWGSSPSLNEYTTLFDRQRPSIHASGIVGGKNLKSDEVIIAGMGDRYSYSLGQYHYSTNGFRENKDQQINLYNLFGQYKLTSTTDVQTELKYKTVTQGDPLLRFHENEDISNYRDKQETSTIRLGVHESITAKSDFLFSAIYRAKNDLNNKSTSKTITNTNFLYDVYQVEAQYLCQHGFTLGGGVTYVDNINNQQQINASNTNQQRNIRHDTSTSYPKIYSYKNIDIGSFQYTLGASLDFYNRNNNTEDEDENPFNPKLGVTYKPNSKTVVRGAVFRALQRSSISNQSLEPTQVAGFDQPYFIASESADSWRYGFGLDHTFTDNLFVGVEMSRRDLQVPYDKSSTDETGQTIFNKEWFSMGEELAKAYINFLPTSRLAFSSEIQFEKLDQDEVLARKFSDLANYSKLTTLRIPLSATILLPFKTKSRVTVSYIDQEGDFFNTKSENFFSDQSNFWNVDASLTYSPSRKVTVSLEAKNLFDQDIDYYDRMSWIFPQVTPSRFVMGKLSLSY